MQQRRCTRGPTTKLKSHLCFSSLFDSEMLKRMRCKQKHARSPRQAASGTHVSVCFERCCQGETVCLESLQLCLILPRVGGSSNENGVFETLGHAALTEQTTLAQNHLCQMLPSTLYYWVSNLAHCRGCQAEHIYLVETAPSMTSIDVLYSCPPILCLPQHGNLLRINLPFGTLVYGGYKAR